MPRLDADRYGAGRLTQIRAASVSGRACRRVGERLGLPERLRAREPAGGVPASRLLAGERVPASVVEAVIGACFQAFGFERTAAAVVDAFAPEIDAAVEHPGDFKSELQEALARRGDTVAYEVIEERGRPHERTFTVRALVGTGEAGRGEGRSKKEAEQEAARDALERIALRRGS